MDEKSHREAEMYQDIEKERHDNCDKESQLTKPKASSVRPAKSRVSIQKKGGCFFSVNAAIQELGKYRSKEEVSGGHL